MDKHQQEQTRYTILSLIQEGRENAISSKEITRLTGISERAIQKAVEELRFELKDKTIVAAQEPPYGYFIPRDKEEAIAWDRQYSARIETYCAVRACVRRVYRIEPDNQMKLNLGGMTC